MSDASVPRGWSRAWLPPLVFAVALVGGLALLLAGPAQGSVEGAALEPVHEVHVDGVGLVDRAPWVVKVERGDTLGVLAQRHLGTVKRTASILALNPGLNPKALRVGQGIVLPPRTATGWLDLYAATPGGIAQPVGLGAPARLPLAPLTIFAVPHERVAILRALDRDQQLLEPLLRADAAVARSEALEAPAAAADGLARAITKLRVAGMRGTRLDVTLLDRHLLSATGHRLVPQAEQGRSEGGLALPLLLVAAGLLVFGLVALAAQRMRAHPGDEPSRLA